MKERSLKISYDMQLKVKVEGHDIYAPVNWDEPVNITWNVTELIKQSSGWDIENEQNNGTAEYISKFIEHGIDELEKHPDKYKKYEAPNGWGTVNGTLKFYRKFLLYLKEYPYAYVFPQ